MPSASVSRATASPPDASNCFAADGLVLHIPASARTHAGFRDWVKSDEFPDKLRCTYIDGEIYLDMSKEELETHAVVKAAVSRVLMNLNEELDLGRFYLDGVLISNVAAKVSNNPDGVFHFWKSLESGRVRFVGRKGKQGQYVEIEGTPDWVMEIISAGSIAKDTKRLRAAYHRASVREYWLIDARGPEINFQVLHWRRAGYVAAARREGWQHSHIFGRSFQLVRNTDRHGLWKYTLLVLPE